MQTPARSRGTYRWPAGVATIFLALLCAQSLTLHSVVRSRDGGGYSHSQSRRQPAVQMEEPAAVSYPAAAEVHSAPGPNIRHVWFTRAALYQRPPPFHRLPI